MTRNPARAFLAGALLAAACGSKTPATAPPAEPVAPAEATAPEATAPATTAPATTAPATTPDEAAPAVAEVNKMAPDFTLTDLDGNKVQLRSLRGKTVVLEWFNPGCPFVRYAHGEGPLKDMSARYMSEGVAWLSINSSAPGREGSGADVNKEASAQWGIKNPVLLDESGAVGHAYGAKSTPHMYVIDPAGKLVYKGALDNAPFGRSTGDSVNYVEAALAAVAAGKPADPAETQSYGCSVKYSN